MSAELSYSAAEELLERYARAWTEFDGDLIVAIHTEDQESHEDPFEPPLVGHNALREALLHAARVEEQVEFTFERHWVVERTILAPWHASYVDRESRARVRMAGFAVFEISDDGRIAKGRSWSTSRAETPAV